MIARRVLVVGSGGREHALLWRLAGDPDPPQLFAVPGNDGMELLAQRWPIAEEDGEALVAACRRERIDLVIVGPDAPVAAGVGDVLEAAGIPALAPTRAAARLEWSKAFAKQVLAAAGVPTARAVVVEGMPDAERALARARAPYVLKADGLAAGKGVLVTSDRDEALAFAAACLEGGRFGDSGRRLVLEEHLTGEEVSATAVCDGRRFVLLPFARDHKRAREGDEGPNTGGMGAYAPVAAGPHPAAVGERIVAPVLAEMARRGTPFHGVLYVGLMVEGEEARVLEINARFGDPESEVLMPLVGGSLTRLLHGAACGALEPEHFEPRDGATVGVALVDEGYPAAVRGGARIEGLDDIAGEDVHVFHAASRRRGDHWEGVGGRIAHVVARAPSRAEARDRAYAAIDRLGGTGWRVRRDIAADAGIGVGSRGRT